MPSKRQAVASIQLQGRDLIILRGLLESRIMTRKHTATIYFEGHTEGAKKRIQKLITACLIGERERIVNQPGILFLRKAGLLLLKNRGILSEYPSLSIPAFEKRTQVSDLTLRHELEVMDVKAAFYGAMRDSETVQIAKFCTWPRLNEFTVMHPHVGKTLVKPDGFIRILKRDSHGNITEERFFLEVDRSTEALDTIIFKATCYINHYRSGDFSHGNGVAKSKYKVLPFRILIILKSEQRLGNIADRLLQVNPPIRTQVLLATIQDVLLNPFGGIWINPGFPSGLEDSKMTDLPSRHRFGRLLRYF
jgi:hypothetical protein